MPYLRKAATDPMTRLLRSYELNGTSLAGLLETCPNTGTKRLLDPNSLTLGELRKLSSKGHIPIDEIRRAV